MTEDIQLVSKSVADFRQLPWHDSELLGVAIEPSHDDSGSTVLITLNVRQPDRSVRSARLTLSPCRAVAVDFDLLGKELCANQIASAVCRHVKGNSDDFVKNIVENFDLYPGETVDDQYLVRILLIHPGGSLTAITKELHFAYTDGV